MHTVFVCCQCSRGKGAWAGGGEGFAGETERPGSWAGARGRLHF